MIELAIKIFHPSRRCNYKLSVDDNIKVKEIKRKIFEILGIIPDLQCLIFKGQLLKDDQDISKYEIGRRTIMLLHRETPIADPKLKPIPLPEVPLNIMLLSGTVDFIMKRTVQPKRLHIKENIVPATAIFIQIHERLVYFNRLLTYLTTYAFGIIPFDSSMKYLEYTQKSFTRLCKIVPNAEDDETFVNYFSMEFNYLCYNFVSCLKYYDSIVEVLEVVSLEEKLKTRLSKIRRRIELIVHHLHYLSHVIHIIEDEVYETRLLPCAIAACNPSPSMSAGFTPTQLCSELQFEVAAIFDCDFQYCLDKPIFCNLMRENKLESISEDKFALEDDIMDLRTTEPFEPVFLDDESEECSPSIFKTE